MSSKAASSARQNLAVEWREVFEAALLEEVFEAALLEKDQHLLPGRLRDAKTAVMDRIEDSFDSTSLAERKLLLAALNTISELQRLAQVDELPPKLATPGVGRAA